MGLEGILIFAIIVILVFYVLQQIPMDQPLRSIVTAVIGVIFILVLLGYIGLGPGFRLGR